MNSNIHTLMVPGLISPPVKKFSFVTQPDVLTPDLSKVVSL